MLTKLHPPSALSGPRRAALALASLLLCASSPLFGETLNWTGGADGKGYNIGAAANWAENKAPDASSDLVFATASADAPIVSSVFVNGDPITINSMKFDNAEGRFNATYGVRVVTSNSNSNTASRTLEFAAPGSILTLVNNAKANIRANVYAPQAGQSILTVNLAYSGEGIIDVDSTSDLTISAGNTTVTGTGGLLKKGEGPLTLSGSHTYSGGFVLEQGTVRFTGSGASNADNDAVANSAWGTGVLTLKGGGLESTGAAGGDPSVVNRTIRSEVRLDGTVAIGSAATGNITVTTVVGKATALLSDSTLDVGGFATWNQTISGGEHSLTKIGGGTLRLNADNDYTGATIVRAGTLRLSGSVAGDLSVESGARLESSGTVHGRLSLASGATLQLGLDANQVASTNAEGGLDLSAVGDGGLLFDLDDPDASDTIKAQNVVYLGKGSLGFASFQFNPLGSFAHGVYTLVSTSGQIEGTLSADNSGPIGTASGTLFISADRTKLNLIVADEPVVVPAITASPESLSVVVGTPVTFTVTATGTDLAYQWIKDGAPLAGETAATLTIATADYTDAGSYSVTVSNAADTLTSDIATLEVTADVVAPAITTAPASQEAIVGDSVTFTVAATGTSPLEYAWSKDGTPIPDATSKTLTIANVTTADAGDYMVTVTNVAGHVDSEAAKLTITTAVAPTISGQPVSAHTALGKSVTLSVTATGTPAPTYQWYRNGAAIAGATSDTYTIESVKAADVGSYTVVVTNAAGSKTSDAAVLTVAPENYLSNLSVRAGLTTTQPLILGFAMEGEAKPILLRAVGPGLANYGIQGYAADPRLDLYSVDTKDVIRTNDNWSSDLAPLFSQLGAAAIPEGSKDAALVENLDQHHTVHANSTANGVALIEAYDAGENDGRRLVNLSARYHVGTGDNVLIAGFVIGGTGTKQVLIRGVGPALANYGVSGVLQDPYIRIYNSEEEKIMENDNWDSSLAATFSKVGAFELTSGSKDAAVIISLPAGSYTVQVSGVGDTTGEALVEVYDLQ